MFFCVIWALHLFLRLSPDFTVSVNPLTAPVFIPQESALAHVELPTTVETVEGAIKKHKDFTTTMELNLHRIKAVIEAGESLISQSNIYSERIKERIDTLSNRCQIY